MTKLCDVARPVRGPLVRELETGLELVGHAEQGVLVQAAQELEGSGVSGRPCSNPRTGRRTPRRARRPPRRRPRRRDWSGFRRPWAPWSSRCGADVLQGEIGVAPEGLQVLDLEDRIAELLEPEDVVPLGLGGRGVVPVALPAAGHELGLELVPGERLGVELEVEVIEQRPVGLAVDRVIVEVLASEAAPHPDPVLDDGAADAEPVVAEVLDPVGAADARPR